MAEERAAKVFHQLDVNDDGELNEEEFVFGALKVWIAIISRLWLDLGDGQFSERCDVDGSFFNSNAIPIIFGKSLISPSSRLFSLTIGNDYFAHFGPIILRLFTDCLGSSERRLY